MVWVQKDTFRTITMCEKGYPVPQIFPSFFLNRKASQKLDWSVAMMVLTLITKKQLQHGAIRLCTTAGP